MKVDWSKCALVQLDGRYQSGAAALKSDPRMTVDGLVESADYGMSPAEISEVYGVPADTVQMLLDYATRHRVPSPAA